MKNNTFAASTSLEKNHHTQLETIKWSPSVTVHQNDLKFTPNAPLREMKQYFWATRTVIPWKALDLNTPPQGPPVWDQQSHFMIRFYRCVLYVSLPCICRLFNHISYYSPWIGVRDVYAAPMRACDEEPLLYGVTSVTVNRILQRHGRLIDSVTSGKSKGVIIAR